MEITLSVIGLIALIVLICFVFDEPLGLIGVLLFILFFTDLCSDEESKQKVKSITVNVIDSATLKNNKLFELKKSE